jgi:hypothetical protein
LGWGVPLRTSLHQHPEDRKTGFLSQGGKAFYSVY